jgi:Tetratricopeptide repeat
LFAILLGSMAPVFLTRIAAAESAPPQVALETNEALFTVLAAINQCGYDIELAASDPLRQQIRDEVKKAVDAAPDSAESMQAMCQFYNEHTKDDPTHTLAEYVSLSLFLLPPPELTVKVKEADLPPDAAALIGMVPMLQKFYAVADLHAIWERHREAYAALAEAYHQPISRMLFDTEIYLKIPSASYLGRSFTVYFDPMGAPSQVNARNYGTDYFVVISPGAGASLKTEQIRHTYLHYLVDPLTLKYPTEIKRLEPLLEATRSAPLDESFKNDVSLLATECFIRAVEARTIGNSKTPEAAREKAVDDSLVQGYILTRYFYDALAVFEKDPAGLPSDFGDMLAHIDVGKENKLAGQIQFATQSDPELLHLSRPAENKMLVQAEERLATGDRETAQKLAQQVLDEKRENPGRALFILAEVATANGNMDGARNYFERALEVAHEPTVVAWSHVYLGRIFDLKEEREAALIHYRAALNSGSGLPKVKEAAEQGLQAPFEPPRPQQ